MYERLKDIIFRNEYITYLKYLQIDTNEILSNIKKRLENKNLFSIFENRSYEMLSPNIILENIIFEEVNKYLYTNSYDLDFFKKNVQLDLKTLIATQNSIIERPKIQRPSKVQKGLKDNLENENGFVRIARFENEMIEKEQGWGRSGQNILFEGLSIFGDNMPFFEGLPSSLIWDNALDFDYPFIIWFGKKFNSIETSNILWVNSLLQNKLELILDDFNNGLQALNKNQEVILEFRQWKSELVENGTSFVGQDSNIAKIEGCDLILREDYYEKLKLIVPQIKFYSKKVIISAP
jgi:hypothetical protein